MKVTAITSRTSFILVALFTFIVSVPAHGQNIRKFSTDGTTTPVIEPGAPTGSFALSGFDNVNLFNGNLNFSLPLLKIGGRGSAGFSLGLKIEKKWRVEYYRTPTGYQSCGQGCVQPIWGPQALLSESQLVESRSGFRPRHSGRTMGRHLARFMHYRRTGRVDYHYADFHNQ